ncbi:MAG TPA: Holliday junction branch migration protein RuvA [Clostridiaceae bacterium]|nr:Holliday junction branch migration protein RuvA [Clostridiaceae bacterium]
MYDYIKGQFKGIYKDYVSIENGGMGYKIYTSGNSMARMPSLDEETTLYLMQIVREDFIGLYGFTTREELDLFSVLITINGVGAKAALSLLSASAPENLKYAIIHENEMLLMKAPGIGKKIAQRLILELKGKLHLEAHEEMDEAAKQKAESENISNEALAALLTLGYGEKEASKALAQVECGQSIENLIKDALKHLMN